MSTTTRNAQYMIMSLIALTSWLANVSCYGQTRLLKSFFEKKEGSYFGYEIAMGYKANTFHSDVRQLNSLRNSQLNTTVGVVFLNKIGKLRGNIGLSYSDDRVPYSINTMEAGIMTNLYVLRLMNKKSDLIEPYLVGRVAYQSARFFGTYTSKDQIVNYSQCDLPAIGRIGWANALAGVGADVRIAGDHLHFLHLFGEVMSGANFLNSSSDTDLSGTSARRPFRATLGVAFGLTRQP